MPNQGRSIKIIFGVAFILIIGIFAFLISKNWEFFGKIQERRIEKSIQDMKKLESFSFEANLSFQTKEMDKEILKTTIRFKNDFERKNDEKFKLAGDFNTQLRFGENQFSLAGENKQIGSVYYFKITESPLLTFSERFLELSGIDLKSIQGQWIFFQQEPLLKTIAKGMPKEEMDRELQENQEKKATIISKAQSALERSYIARRQLPKGEIDGIKVDRYLVLLNKERIRTILPELFNIMGEFLGPEEILNFGISQDLLPRVNEFLEVIDGFSAEIWIGQKDNYIYKIKIEQEVNLAKPAKPVILGGGIPDIIPASAILKLDLNFSNFNQSFRIGEPKDHKNFEDLIPLDFYVHYFDLLFYEGER